MGNLYPFLVYVFVTTFTPGPNNIMAMTHGMRFGYKGTFRFIIGMVMGFCLLMLVCGLINVALVNLLPQARFWLNILGAAYMIYLAAHTILSTPVEEGLHQSGLNSFVAGFGMQFLNLKVILYGVTVYSIFITQTYQNPFVVSLFAPLLAGIGFLATSCWALGGSVFRVYWRKHFRLFNYTMGALLIYTAIASLSIHR
jgi:threonine/homoserine/homoserine lactone efflux protein